MVTRRARRGAIGTQLACVAALLAFGGTAAQDEAPAAPGPLPCADEPLPAGGEPLYALPREGLWGYVNRAGEWIVEPSWQQAEPFSEGRAAVSANGAWGVIDRNGEYVLEPSLRPQTWSTVDGQRVGTPPLKPFSHGCAPAVADVAPDPPFFVDRDGGLHWREGRTEALAEVDVREFGRFHEGKAWFRGFDMEMDFVNPHGWIDTAGNLVLGPDFTGAGDFEDGLAPAAIDRNAWGIIDADGSLVMPGKWTLEWASSFSEGMAPVQLGPFENAYLRRDGDFLRYVRWRDEARTAEYGPEVTFRATGPFRDGLAPVMADTPGGGTFLYLRPDGTVAFVPDELEGITVCNERMTPSYRDGLVRWLVARDGQHCGDVAVGSGLASFPDAVYVYADTEGNIVLGAENLEGRGGASAGPATTAPSPPRR